MKLRKNALIAMGLAFSMVVQTPMAAFATETQTTEVVAEAAENATENAAATAEETVQVDETQLSPWLITEVVADTVTGERYTYAEIYNNSDAELDLADYVLYYDYHVAGQEGGYVFSKNAEVSYTYPGQTKAYTKSGFYSASSTDQVTSIPVKSGEALVLWYNNNLSTTSLEEFKTFYGLGDDVNIIRINHSGLHQSKNAVSGSEKMMKQSWWKQFPMQVETRLQMVQIQINRLISTLILHQEENVH